MLKAIKKEQKKDWITKLPGMPKFARTPLSLIFDSTLTQREIRVLLCIIAHADTAGSTKKHSLSLDNIAQMCQFFVSGKPDRSSVSRVVTSLCKKGWLQIHKRRGLNATQYYQLIAKEVLPFDEQDTDAVDETSDAKSLPVQHEALNDIMVGDVFSIENSPATLFLKENGAEIKRALEFDPKVQAKELPVQPAVTITLKELESAKETVLQSKTYKMSVSGHAFYNSKETVHFLNQLLLEKKVTKEEFFQLLTTKKLVVIQSMIGIEFLQVKSL